jgi:hypothetical protein
MSKKPKREKKYPSRRKRRNRSRWMKRRRNPVEMGLEVSTFRKILGDKQCLVLNMSKNMDRQSSPRGVRIRRMALKDMNISNRKVGECLISKSRDPPGASNQMICEKRNRRIEVAWLTSHQCTKIINIVDPISRI